METTKNVLAELNNDQRRLENVISAFATLSSQMGQISTELRDVTATFDERLAKALSDAAAAADAHLKETVAAAESNPS